MAQAVALPLSFLEFLETILEDGKRYDLVNGERVEVGVRRISAPAVLRPSSGCFRNLSSVEPDGRGHP